MLGLTKYCSQFLNGNPCKYPNCIYRHEMADEDCTFTLQEVREGFVLFFIYLFHS